MNTCQLYFVYHKGFNAWKVGISNESTNNRVAYHEKNDWMAVAVWTQSPCLEVNEAENEVVKMWRKKDLPYGNIPIFQSGFGETVSGDYVNLEDVKKLVTKCSEILGVKPYLTNFDI